MYLNGVKQPKKKKHSRAFITTPKQYQQILKATTKEERKGKRIIEVADEIYKKHKVKISP